MKNLEGIIIPAITPFEKDGRLSMDKLAVNYEAWNRSKVQGYMCLGSNGELRSIDDDESLAVIRCASVHSSFDKVLIGGVGRESVQHTVISSTCAGCWHSFGLCIRVDTKLFC
jgi:4-hydroxy-2-oxoglutarate aldolase